jgi:hypothetical protein
MRFFAILFTFLSLGLVQAPDNRPTSEESRAPATPPQGQLPPVPRKTLPSASSDSNGRATRPQDLPPDPDLSSTVEPDLSRFLEQKLYPDITDIMAREDPKKYSVGVAKGRAEAEEQLSLNEAEIWSYGLVMFSDLVDRKTGLYFSSFGCSIDPELVGRVEGHNARIAESIRDHGPPKNSFKPWEKELFGLAEYFESRSRIENPIRLTVGGPAARSPDGQFVVKLVKRLYKAPVEFKIEPAVLPCILVGEADTEANRILWSMEDSELAWGPKGSWFAVLKGRGKKGERMNCIAIDLRGIRPIREESGK